MNKINNNMSVFDISGRAMSAQMIRMNATASNLANARSIASTEEGAFRSIRPVFETIEDRSGMATVGVDRVVQSDLQPEMRHDPSHPLANEEGYVWEAAVDESAELIEMLETSRQYQNNVQVLQTAKMLLVETLKMGG